MSTPSRASIIKAANVELIVDGNVDAIADYFTESYVAHLTDGAKLTGGHATIGKVVEMYHRAFADLVVEVDVLVEGTSAEGTTHRIAWQRTIRAKHIGNFKGFPATNETIVWREMLTRQFNADNLIEQEWVISDLAEQLLRARKK